MGRKVAKLAPTEVTALVKAGDKGMHADGGNLYLQVAGPGTASWIFRYAERGSGRNGAKPKSHWLGLGPVHTVSLREAREEARRCRQQLLDGADPAKLRLAAKAAPAAVLTFGEAAELYIKAQEPGWRSAIHARQWRNSLRDHAAPVLGHLAISAIGLGDVTRVLEPIWRSKTETASRVRQRIESILEYAKVRGWRTGDNPARWTGLLEHVLPAKETVAPVQHHAALEWQATPAFLAALAARQGMAAKALTFLILTATRSMETRGATWVEIDLDAATWTIPASRMKANREHRVPLADAALAILREMRPEQAAPDALVFPGAKEGKPLSDVALGKLLPAGITCHGFRSTFRTWAGETTDFPREVVEMALAHRLGDSVEQAYARGDLFRRRRLLMDAWAAHCIGAQAGENVVALRTPEVAA